MRAILLLLTGVLAISAFAEAQTASAGVEVEIARIDRLATNPDTKLQIIQSMAVDLGTHRNHLIFLKKQGAESFGQIYARPRKIEGVN